MVYLTNKVSYMYGKIDLMVNNYIKNSILPRYEKFEDAHNRQHIQFVIDKSLVLAQRYDVNARMVYICAAYHDIGREKGQDNHALSSGKILANDEVMQAIFTGGQIKIMVEAIEDHSASSRSEPRSIYGKILYQADRSLDLDIIIKRAVCYGLTYYPEYTYKQQFERVYSYITTKYGEGGSLTLWIDYKSDIENLQLLRTQLRSKKLIEELFDKYYQYYVEVLKRDEKNCDRPFKR